MIKLSDARSAYEDFSGKASEITRQLALAGIALIWVFKVGDANHPQLDPKLLHAALYLIFALVSDLVQYVTSSLTWISYFGLQGRKGKKLDDEVSPPIWLNWPNYFFYSLKIVLLLIAYLKYLLPYASWRIH